MHFEESRRVLGYKCQLFGIHGFMGWCGIIRALRGDGVDRQVADLVRRDRFGRLGRGVPTGMDWEGYETWGAKPPSDEGGGSPNGEPEGEIG